jgi:hypothetical protein
VGATVTEREDEMIARLVSSLSIERVLRAFEPRVVLDLYTREQRLAGLTREQRLAGLTREQRLAGLAPEDMLPTIPIEALRRLPDDYLRTLPEHVQQAIRARLASSP